MFEFILCVIQTLLNENLLKLQTFFSCRPSFHDADDTMWSSGRMDLHGGRKYYCNKGILY